MQHKSTEEYSAKQCKQHKVEINRVVAKRAQQLQVDVQAFHALFLDSIEAGTASELKRGGFMECNLHIPNICPEVCASLQQRLPTADVYPGSVHDYLQTFKQQHHLIYFDYCCTYDGNQHTDPLSDMESMFDHGHLAEKCIVAHTFNKRGYSNEAAMQRCRTATPAVYTRSWRMATWCSYFTPASNWLLLHRLCLCLQTHYLTPSVHFRVNTKQPPQA
jgi:hypothetical protein